MALTHDSLGNYFLGNNASGDSFSISAIFSCLRASLGSDNRAGLNGFRIDWRSNINEEVFTGSISQSYYLNINNSDPYFLATNARMAFSFVNSATRNAFVGTSGQNTYNSGALPDITSSWLMWVVANERSINIFTKNDSSTFFFSQGTLLNSPLPYPFNNYFLAGQNNYIQGFVANATDSPVLLQTNGSIANYPHIKLDGSATDSEVEMYVRNSSLLNYGYIPNLFKWKQNNGETSQVVGDIVKLDLTDAAGYYADRGNILCMVIGRLGDTSNTDAGGDYLLMPIKF